jgi:hypothetical protein
LENTWSHWKRINRPSPALLGTGLSPPAIFSPRAHQASKPPCRAHSFDQSSPTGFHPRRASLAGHRPTYAALSLCPHYPLQQPIAEANPHFLFSFDRSPLVLLFGAAPLLCSSSAERHHRWVPYRCNVSITGAAGRECPLRPQSAELPQADPSRSAAHAPSSAMSGPRGQPSPADLQ